MKVFSKIQQAIARTKPRQVKIAKFVIASLAIILAVTDAIFAKDDFDNLETYSWLFKKKQSQMLWFTFLFGVLTGKIFYNKFTSDSKQETRGVLILGGIVLMLIALGKLLGPPQNVDVWVEFMLFTGGILGGHLIWPQYRKENNKL
jgi:hypothetical protein